MGAMTPTILKVRMPDGSIANIPAVVGPRGVGIKSAVMDEAGELKITYTDGRVANIGNIKGPAPVKGTDYWTEEDKAEIKTEAEPLYVTLTVDASGAPIADKTFKEIKKALDDNKNVYIKSTTEGATILGAVTLYSDNILYAYWFDPSWYGGYRTIIESDNTITINEIRLIDTIIGNENVVDSPPTVNAVAEYVTAKTVTKMDKPTVLTPSGISELILENNQEARLGKLEAGHTLALHVPLTDSMLSGQDAYSSYFNFTSGDTAPTLTYASSPIVWRGDDCDEEGLFIPEANANYEVSVRYLGTDSEGNPVVVARVGAY